eukprot:1610528-Ditylum_brightwellii.AAC.1
MKEDEGSKQKSWYTVTFSDNVTVYPTPHQSNYLPSQQQNKEIIHDSHYHGKQKPLQWIVQDLVRLAHAKEGELSE